MTTFYAFEIATNSFFHIQVDQDERKLNEILDSELKRLEKWLDGTTIMGHVDANDVESAIDKVRCGKWTKWHVTNMIDNKTSSL